MQDYQHTLFPYAYNILGSAEDARDAIQDVLVSYISADRDAIENEKNYLVRSVINQSINIKKRKQKIIGDTTWLPEPVATEQADTNLKRTEIISYSMLVLLEHLNPRERATFILKEAFDYSHEEIAGVLSVTVENSRKLLSRAKSKLAISREVKQDAWIPGNSYLENYIAVIKSGDTQALEKMLSADISVTTDGGGRVSIVRELTQGVQATMDLMVYVYHAYQQSLTMIQKTINHQPALLFYNGDLLTNCQVFDIDKASGQIRNIYSIVDPEKLKNIEKAR